MANKQGGSIQGRTYHVNGEVRVTQNGITWDNNALPQDQLKNLQDDISNNRFCMVQDDQRLYQFIPLTESSGVRNT